MDVTEGNGLFQAAELPTAAKLGACASSLGVRPTTLMTQTRVTLSLDSNGTVDLSGGDGFTEDLANENFHWRARLRGWGLKSHRTVELHWLHCGCAD